MSLPRRWVLQLKADGYEGFDKDLKTLRFLLERPSMLAGMLTALRAFWLRHRFVRFQTYMMAAFALILLLRATQRCLPEGTVYVYWLSDTVRVIFGALVIVQFAVIFFLPLTAVALERFGKQDRRPLNRGQITALALVTLLGFWPASYIPLMSEDILFFGTYAEGQDIWHEQTRMFCESTPGVLCYQEPFPDSDQPPRVDVYDVSFLTMTKRPEPLSGL